MIKLKEPASMTTLKNITVLDDWHSITAMYDLTLAKIRPEDLLFLLTNPPELPLPDGSHTTFNINNTIENNENLILDIVNNIVNRIAFADQKKLSYKDSVYLEAALSRLGIKEAAVFLKKAFLMAQESRSMLKLIHTYESNHKTLERVFSAESDTLHKSESVEIDGGKKERLYLHRAIFDRLQSSLIYDLVNAFYSESEYNKSFMGIREMYTTEYKRLSHLLRLENARQRLFFNNTPELNLTHNSFETGYGMDLPQSREQVTEQALSAALSDFIDLCVISRADYLYDKSLKNINIKSAVRYFGQNSIARYIAYRQDTSFYNAPAEPAALNTRLIKENDIVLTLIKNEEQLLEFNNLSITELKAILESFNGAKYETSLNSDEDRLTLLNALNEQVNNINADNNITNGGDLIKPTAFDAKSIKNILNNGLFDTINTKNSSIYNMEWARQNIFNDGSKSITAYETLEEEDAINTKEYQSLIREALIKTDKQNRERLEHMNEIISRLGADGKKERVIDRQRLIKNSLMALEQPETVYNNTQNEETLNNSRLNEITRPLTLLMEGADPATKQALEQIIEFQSRRESLQKSASIDSVNMINMLNETIKSANINALETDMKERQVLFKHLEETVSASETLTHTVKERFEQNATINDINFIHKKEHFLDEEKPQTPQSEQIVNETVQTLNSQQTIISKDTLNLSQNILAKNTQDVTELVNKTLMKQLGVITDRVYGQLEKKLSGERTRRGR